MFTPDIAPVGGSLLLSSLLALLPLVTVFVTLGGLKWKAHWAGLAGLGAALVVAVAAFGMPGQLAGLSALQGAAFGLFPIMWIVVCAVWLYELTVRSGRFDDLRAVIDRISDDPRIQAMLIAFCFGGLLEALAGFGAPIAITGVMLLAVGFSRMRAAMVVLVANTAPVAFGAIATPIITAGSLTGIDYEHIGAIVGRQTPLIAVFVPLFLCLLADGWKGVKQVWPMAVVVGVVFSAVQFVSSNFLSVELTDVVAALAGLAAAVIMLRFWQPGGTEEARARLTRERDSEDADTDEGAGTAVRGTLTGSRVFLALFPYLLVVVVFSAAKLWTPLVNGLAATDLSFGWPGLHGNVVGEDGEAVSSTVFSFPWLSSPGTLLLLTGVVVAIVYRMRAAEAVRAYAETVVKMRFSILTVVAVLSLAYVMNQSGQTITVGTWIAGAGVAFAYFAPVLGWLGTAVTGSDTSANALFATLQQTAATNAGLDPALMVAANTSGGVVGKLISPQNLAIAATAVNLVGRESDLLRKVIWWSVGMLAALCLLNGLQAGVLSWMIPAE